jgi:hypothetical protein
VAIPTVSIPVSDISPPPLSKSDPQVARAKTCAYPKLISPQNLSFEGLICVVVRTYLEHLLPDGNSVRHLMTCLEQMEYPHWTAIFFSHQNYSLDPIKEIFAERTHNYTYLELPDVPPTGREDNGFTATDMAITYCPPETRWLVVTQSNNDYSPKSFSYLDPGVDAISMDIFLDIPIGIKYDKFPEAQPDVFPNKQDFCTQINPICYWNRRGVKKMDLGSIIYKMGKWRKENIMYSKFTTDCCHDGMLTEDLRYRGWIMNALPFCYFSKGSNQWGNCRHNFGD